LFAPRRAGRYCECSARGRCRSAGRDFLTSSSSFSAPDKTSLFPAGRTEVARWFLDLGVRPDVAPYLGRTGLHWAIPGGQLEVIRLLLERGADPSIRDELFQADADGWQHINFATRWHDPVIQQIHDLIESRSP
jgi:ankyrin repeat protein